ncbi:hypothetical protein BRE01_62390 [Brevibacillus reuszeri]|uniref:Uncharacterized protein n=1 Tax=Brevibacillus reuszeri TaxID=54915 RepID=A0A0K9YXG0_9BACL|nr:hypothetical protein [Brevibacillus reuszeri]KNB72935.1 hypothetical protein ADS79_14000 [Brevibacillus reuszeri]GED72537.1 hypothetical protein BRE01_62390 [Brevibacillus reuszeri]
MSEYNTGDDTYHDGKFILLNNKYYTESDPQQLTPKELHTLIILKIFTSQFKGVNVTTYNLMGHLLPFTNVSEKKKNAAVAKELMQSLKVKGIIEYDDPKDSNEPITVTIEPVKYVEGDDRTSFQPVPEFILDRTNDPDEIYVLIAIHNVAKMCEKGEYAKPFFRNKKNWGALLGKGNTTAEKIVNSMCVKGILFYYENDVHYDQNRSKFEQGHGKYYLFPQEKEEARIRLRDEKRRLNRKVD